MMWSVKAVFTERRSGLAGIATLARSQGWTIQDLRSTSGWNNQIIDEIVLVTPAGTTAASLTEQLLSVGSASAQVVEVDAARPDSHVNAMRKARLAHPAGTHRALRLPLAS